MEVLETQHLDQVVDVPVVMQQQVPAVPVVQKTVEEPPTQFFDSVVELSVVQQRRRQDPMVQMFTGEVFAIPSRQ